MNTIIGERPKTPWHLWVIGVVSLLFFMGGANDYIQVKTGNAEYMAAMATNLGSPLETVEAYFASYPLWANIFWALGVWGAIAGAILLLLRSRFAVLALMLSLAGLIVNTIHRYLSPLPMNPEVAQMSSTFLLAFSAVIWLSVILLAIYARRMTNAGVLR